MRLSVFSTLAIGTSLVQAAPDGGLHPAKVLEARASCTEIVPNNCSFYRDCLEATVSCGADGYPISYGEHYCNEFTASSAQLSPQGQIWVTDTMVCLQEALVPWITGEMTGTCEDLADHAFSTHSDCYIDSGVSALGPADWAVIVHTVGLEGLFGSWEGLLAAVETGVGCVEFYSWLTA